MTKPSIITEIERFNTRIAFLSSCGHWHARPSNWKVQINDDFICPICYTDDEIKESK
jgi:hypothetical protein